MNNSENTESKPSNIDEDLENASGGNNAIFAAVELFFGIKDAKHSSEELAQLKEFASSEVENSKGIDAGLLFPKQDENEFFAKMAIIEQAQVKNHDQ